MKTSANDAALRAADIKRTQMKNVPVVAVLCVLAIAAFASQSARAEEGVALAIIYDTSGSMKDLVKDQNGKPAPKYVIANRALTSIARQIQSFATNNSGPPRKIEAGVFVFDKNSAREAIKFGPFDERAIEAWADNFSNPSGSTPLGNALKVASRAVMKSPLSHKHVLIITDGMNTVGPKPEQVLPTLKQEAQDKGGLSVHFVAFDVDAKVFEPVKKLDATVVAAADEKQLDTQLQFILQRKILLEEEETPKKP